MAKAKAAKGKPENTIAFQGEAGANSDMACRAAFPYIDRKSTRLNSSHTVIYTLSLHDALPIYGESQGGQRKAREYDRLSGRGRRQFRHGLPSGLSLHRSEEHTSELQSHRDLHSFPTRRSSDLWRKPRRPKESPRIRSPFRARPAPIPTWPAERPFPT